MLFLGDKMESIFETLFRTTVGFIVLLIVTRMLGKKQLGQLTIFTYITGIALGNMAGDMNIPTELRRNIPAEIIVDGKLVSQNITEIGLDPVWLDQQIK